MISNWKFRCCLQSYKPLGAGLLRIPRGIVFYFQVMQTSRNARGELPAIVLRHFRPDDAVTHLQGEDEAISMWLSGGVSTLDSVMRWIESNDDNWANGGPRFAFAIQTPEGELVGMIEINVDYSHFAGLQPGDANVSYGLYPQYRGRGLASSALLNIQDFMIREGIKRAVVRIEPENGDSVRLMERAGFLLTGVVMNGVGTEYLIFVDDLARDTK